MAAALQQGVLVSQTSPAFLHANSTSHTWIFSAIAELVDNAYDPDVKASQLYIDLVVTNKVPCLVLSDNGSGMAPDKLHKMLSFGYCEKVEINGHKPVGHYGNGFKSGSMRLGKDALVFTKCADTMSVGFLSQTYLAAIEAQTVLVPIVTWNIESQEIVPSQDSEGSLKAITKHSLFHSAEELREAFQNLDGRTTGTHILMYNLKRSSDQRLEMDFESIPTDIINSEHQEFDRTAGVRVVADYQPEYKKSLREYLSLLFLKPRMKIILRGKKVKTTLIAKSLSKTEKDVYKPHWLPKPVMIIFGFGQSKEDYGMMLYHRNRLIKAYERVGLQKQANLDGVGVVGVAEVDFLEPVHNKQEFNKTDRYNACMTALSQKLNDYWWEKSKTRIPRDAADQSAQESQQTPDWTWVQCDSCLKWRRLPLGYTANGLPEKWFCYRNPDPVHNQCDVDEEPEDEDELLQKPTYQKTYKREKEIEKLQGQRQRELDLQQKERELRLAKQQIQMLKAPLQERNRQPGTPTVADLERAKRDLEVSKRREQEQAAHITQLQQQKQQVEKQMQNLGTMANKDLSRLNRIARNGQSDAAGASSGSRKRKQVDKHLRVRLRTQDFAVTENVSSSESSGDERRNPPTAGPSRKKRSSPIKRSRGRCDDVIILDSDIEDGEANDKGDAAGEVQVKRENGGDVKPNLESLNRQVAAGMAASSEAKPEMVHRFVQTLPVEQGREEVQARGEGPSTSPGTSSTDHDGLQERLKQKEEQLVSLRRNVGNLLKTILPDLDISSLEYIDEIVVEMVRVNSENSDPPEIGTANHGDQSSSNAASGSTQSNQPQKQDASNSNKKRRIDNNCQVINGITVKEESKR